MTVHIANGYAPSHSSDYMFNDNMNCLSGVITYWLTMVINIFKLPFNLSTFNRLVTGLVFTKGLRLSLVLGLNPVLKLRLLSQLSFVLKPYSQRVT